MTPILERGRMLNGASSANTLAGEELTCVIDLGNDMYDSNGLKTGFSYDLLNRFAKDNRCNVKIVIPDTSADYQDSLENGRVDILITSTSDATISEHANVRQLDRHTLWAVNKEERQKARSIDVWMSHIKGSDTYDRLQGRYYRSFNPHKRAQKNIRSEIISPYDDLFRKYAAELGWGWRMLAAVVYQESKFSINSVSHRGAVGLMQVKPQTAGHYGIDDLFDPARNLEAGTSHLKRLQKLYSKDGLEGAELVKFTLAAYNAGEGRIADCRRFAKSRNLDNGSWDNIVQVIPMMREDSILENENVKLGKFQGHETIAYIDNVMSLYESICSIHPSAK